MNYSRIKNIFVDLYEELCETFDDFESDFSEAIGNRALQESSLYPERTDVVCYFEKITESQEAAENFIREILAPSVRARSRFDVSSSYHYIIAKETMTNHILVGRDPAVNYNAFIKKLAIEFKLYKKDIHDLIRAENNVE
jgi:hypothetical protein